MASTTEARQHWLGLMARAPDGRVAALLSKSGLTPEYSRLRSPEIGTVMVRGRMGGTGGAFNLSEMTVTRASVSLGSGTVGHGYVKGRSKAGAEAAAVIDALMQTDAAERVANIVLDPLEAEEADRRAKRSKKAAATKVDFFTMVRGEPG